MRGDQRVVYRADGQRREIRGGPTIEDGYVDGLRAVVVRETRVLHIERDPLDVEFMALAGFTHAQHERGRCALDLAYERRARTRV